MTSFMDLLYFLKYVGHKLTDSVPPSILTPPRYHVMCAGGLEPELLQTISDWRPTTIWSPLFEISTETGETGKKEKDSINNFISIHQWIPTGVPQHTRIP